MSGTVLAVISFAFGLALALGGALLALKLTKRPQEAKPTPERREERFVTLEQMEAAIEKVTKELEWEWTEMYEKFEKLHLRLAKRDARAKAKPDDQLALEERPVLDIRQYRRL